MANLLPITLLLVGIVACSRATDVKFRPGYNPAEARLAKIGDSKIIGGSNAAKGQFPFQCSLRCYGDHMCGCSILSKNHVLTARHCHDACSLSQITIVAGSIDMNDKSNATQKRRVRSAYIAPESDQDQMTYDLAIYEVDMDFHWTDTVAPIPLYGGCEMLPGTSCYVSGWGTTSESGSISQYLKYAKVNVVDIDDCNGKYSSYGGVDSTSMLCAAADKTDSCQGDSGGPLFVSIHRKHYLIGGVSWGLGCARKEYPGVYAATASVRKWIQNVINGTCSN